MCWFAVLDHRAMSRSISSPPGSDRLPSAPVQLIVSSMHRPPQLPAISSAALLILAALSIAPSCDAQVPAGRWDGTVVYGTMKVPFRIDFDGTGSKIRGTLINGDTRISSTSGSFADDHLRLVFESTGTRLDAVLKDERLDGYFETSKDGRHPFTASAFCSCGYEGEAGPDISGAWEIPEAAWRLAIFRKGEDTFVKVLRSGEEIGPLAGRFDGVTFALHYFDGPRAIVLELEPTKDGRLAVLWQEANQSPKKYVAVRKL